MWSEAPAGTITIHRDGNSPIRVEPATVLMTGGIFGLSPDSGEPLDLAPWRIEPPDGWSVLDEDPQGWRVRPRRASLDHPARFRAVEREGGRVHQAKVEIALDLRSAFDPRADIFPLPNRASVVGEQRPRREIFEQTYTPMAKAIERTLFEGLYSDIVFLSAGDGRHGGLCSGMARWAIACGQGIEAPPASHEQALERIAVYHGRQLGDRALLSALPWFLRGSPRAAFRAVRGDLLSRGMTDRALDIKVPKIWRRDLFTALVVSGHTLVPYYLRQHNARYGEIEVYDPNEPDAAGSDHPRVIRFDLEADRYEYDGKVTLEDDKVGIIAVRQTAYADRGSAYLAFFGSLLFAPRRGVASLTGREGRGARRIGG